METLHNFISLSQKLSPNFCQGHTLPPPSPPPHTSPSYPISTPTKVIVQISQVATHFCLLSSTWKPYSPTASKTISARALCHHSRAFFKYMQLGNAHRIKTGIVHVLVMVCTITATFSFEREAPMTQSLRITHSLEYNPPQEIGH